MPGVGERGAERGGALGVVPALGAQREPITTEARRRPRRAHARELERAPGDHHVARLFLEHEFLRDVCLDDLMPEVQALRLTACPIELETLLDSPPS